MQTQHSIIHNAIASLFPSDIHTAPLLLIHSSTMELGDESGRLTLIYQENEHFIHYYDKLLQDNPHLNHALAHDHLSNIANKIAATIFQAINTPEFEYKPSFKPIDIQSGLIELFINEHNDSLSVQISDHHYYIAFTASGQY